MPRGEHRSRRDPNRFSKEKRPSTSKSPNDKRSRTASRTGRLSIPSCSLSITGYRQQSEKTDSAATTTKFSIQTRIQSLSRKSLRPADSYGLHSGNNRMPPDRNRISDLLPPPTYDTIWSGPSIPHKTDEPAGPYRISIAPIRKSDSVHRRDEALL